MAALNHNSQHSFKALSQPYEPRRPEETVLYRAVAGNIKTFLALIDLEGKRLPKHVVEEFDAFLKCGIFAHGFLRLRCQDSKAEKILPLSCKKRGFCASCGGRRMAECEAHLMDNVLPTVGIRQWVISFPMPVRFILARANGVIACIW